MMRHTGFLFVLLLATAGAGRSALGEDEVKIQIPAALTPGDTIAFVAPSGPSKRPPLELAKTRLEAMGFKVQIPGDIDRKKGYLSGDDATRAAELMAAFANPEVDAVFCVRGGYGTSRILESLDFGVISKNPKIFMGYSDITALHVAIHQKTGLVTFHSPMMESGLGKKASMTPFSTKYFWRAILGEKQTPGGYTIEPLTVERDEPAIPPPVALVAGKARGRLVGGNLSVVHAVMGSEYEIETDGKILFLEDVGEAPYRVDRMLQCLRLAGKLDNLAGVVLGGFTRRDDEDTSGEETTIDDVLRDFFAESKVPVVMGFPAGHQKQNATLAIGAMVELDAGAGTVRLLENPVKAKP